MLVLLLYYYLRGLVILSYRISGFLCLMGLARTMSHPLFTAWINNHIDSKVRATVLSVSSQANAIGQIMGGPPVGYLGILNNLRIAISVSGILMLPAVLLASRIRAKGREKVEVVAE